MTIKTANPLGQNGRSDIWTPQWFLNQLRSQGWDFGLDVCACADSSAAGRHFDKEANGLLQDWKVDAKQVVWCNPPFGDCREWIVKAIQEARSAENPARTLVLLPANVGSQWFRDLVPYAASVTIITPRLNYYLPSEIRKEEWKTMHVSGGRLMVGVAFSSCLWYITPFSAAKRPARDQEAVSVSWREYRKPKGAER